MAAKLIGTRHIGQVKTKVPSESWPPPRTSRRAAPARRSGTTVSADRPTGWWRGARNVRPRAGPSERTASPRPRVHAAVCGRVWSAGMGGITHEEYLAAITVEVCEQYPATAAALSEVQLVFGTGPRRRGLTTLQRVWGGGGEAGEPLPLVEIVAIGGLTPPETCHVVLHELAHVLAPGSGHGKEWRYAARQVGLLQPRAWPDAGELADWGAIASALRARLQAVAEPTERVPADYYYDWLRRGCGAGYGTRGGTSRGEGAGSRYLRVVCQEPGCGYQVRVTRKWLRLGAPRCPIADHGSMKLEE